LSSRASNLVVTVSQNTALRLAEGLAAILPKYASVELLTFPTTLSPEQR
jgi:hypothetical protein